MWISRFDGLALSAGWFVKALSLLRARCSRNLEEVNVTYKRIVPE